LIVIKALLFQSTRLRGVRYTHLKYSAISRKRFKRLLLINFFSAFGKITHKFGLDNFFSLRQTL